MENHPIEGLMLTAMNSIESMIDVNTIIGEPIETSNNIVILLYLSSSPIASSMFLAKFDNPPNFLPKAILVILSVENQPTERPMRSMISL